MSESRERLSSRLGFLMLAAGCAVGLGNVWRFPFVVGENGGAVFVLVYLAFLALFGFPLLTAELAEGRGAQKGIASGLRVLAPSRWKKCWGTIGLVVFAGNFLLMIYYTDVAGWLLRYTVGYAVPAVMPAVDTSEKVFNAVIADKSGGTVFTLAAVIVSTMVCMGGVVRSVERITKWMMIALLLLLIVLAAKALSLEGAAEGLEFYLKPDWQVLCENPGKVIFNAMGQSFFTLSLGVGCMTIFGSYIGKEHSLVKESILIILIDTFVALMAGLIIFPACCTYKVAVTQGPGLIFVALPNVFAKMTHGGIWAFVFFLFLSFAALTTIIAVFECLIGGIIDLSGRKRFAVSAIVGTMVFLVALPCVLFDGVLEWEDFIFSNLWLPLGAMCSCLFCTCGFGWGWDRFRNEASCGDGLSLPDWLRPIMTFLLPIAIIIICAVGVCSKF